MPTRDGSLTTAEKQTLWYTRPQTLIPAAGIAYLLMNKKTRKTGLLLGGGFLVFNGFNSFFGGSLGGDKTASGIGKLAMGAGGVLLFLGLRSK